MIVAVILYAECLAIVPLTLIRMQERSHVFVSITLFRFVVMLGLSVTFVVALGWGVRGALLANAASALGVLLILLPEYRVVIRGRLSRCLLRQMLAFGLPFFPVIFSAWFIEASDRYLLGIYRTTAEVGYYVLGYKVAAVMQIAVTAFTMGWGPLCYRIAARRDARAVYRRLTNSYVLASSLLTVIVAVAARAIVAIIAPHSYSTAATIVPLIALSYSLNGLYVLMVTGMAIRKRTAPMAWIVGLAALVNIGLNILLIPRFGMPAAAATTCLSNVIMVAGGWFYSQRVYPIPYDWRRIGRVIVVGVGVVAPTVLLTPGAGILGLVSVAGATLTFVALLIKIHAITSTDRAAMRAWLAHSRSALEVRSRQKGLIRDQA